MNKYAEALGADLKNIGNDAAALYAMGVLEGIKIDDKFVTITINEQIFDQLFGNDYVVEDYKYSTTRCYHIKAFDGFKIVCETYKEPSDENA